mmetsp:Transcript_17163/g.41228  ORF Transcript_17163/g.41228 Transcript_17163/m.41228 type:complete len:227 (+) Transcript_17163:264-944(+)
MANTHTHTHLTNTIPTLSLPSPLGRRSSAAGAVVIAAGQLEGLGERHDLLAHQSDDGHGAVLEPQSHIPVPQVVFPLEDVLNLLAAEAEHRVVHRLDDLVPDGDLVALVLARDVGRREVDEELLEVPVELGGEVRLHVEGEDGLVALPRVSDGEDLLHLEHIHPRRRVKHHIGRQVVEHGEEGEAAQEAAKQRVGASRQCFHHLGRQCLWAFHTHTQCTDSCRQSQ